MRESYVLYGIKEYFLKHHGFEQHKGNGALARQAWVSPAFFSCVCMFTSTILFKLKGVESIISYVFNILLQVQLYHNMNSAEHVAPGCCWITVTMKSFKRKIY